MPSNLHQHVLSGRIVGAVSGAYYSLFARQASRTPAVSLPACHGAIPISGGVIQTIGSSFVIGYFQSCECIQLQSSIYSFGLELDQKKLEKLWD
ncbi:MAG: hypothetical protein EZS28_000909 [Streblomastix strix]|uniref:Uncharacterized protein n=1 Tax=Streblomastix strix TaxID=222440 RepID=A0A5J4X916_9EUKA|nr:MAG: hypothetical protein EZS28_000909 [Streblomastix strix]